MIRALILLSFFGLAGCGAAPRINMISDLPEMAGSEQVFVATNRVFSDQNYRAGRADHLDYTRFTVSIPPDREIGEISWPSGDETDPNRHFAVTEAERYGNPAQFRGGIAQALAELPREDREVVVFVHGFNNNFASGLFRVAQMAHDYEAPGLVAHFSWPSGGHPLGYVYDRDSVLASRDALQQFLQDLAAAGTERILLVAHSMGTHLVTETLRQMRLSGQDALINRLSAVVLISPDIDVDVFHSQARAIEPLPQPFVLITSHRDRILRLSAGLSGQSDRLGNIQSPEEVGDLDVIVIEISDFEGGSGDFGHHSTFASSPSLIQLFRGLPRLAQGQSEVPVGLWPGTVLSVRNATQVLLTPVGP